MPLVEGRKRVGRPLVGEHDDRGIREAKLEVTITRAELVSRPQATLVERLHGVGDCEILEQRKLGIDAEATENQVIRLGRCERGDHELARPLLQRRENRRMIRVSGVGGAVESTGVDDQRLYRPSSSRTSASALRAIAAPSP